MDSKTRRYFLKYYNFLNRLKLCADKKKGFSRHFSFFVLSLNKEGIIMKKSVILLFFSLLALGFFACDFESMIPNPSAIEIKGTPTIRFAETVEIGKMFKDLIDDALENGNNAGGLEFIPCTNTDDVTFLIYMNLFDTDFEAIEHEDDVGNLIDHFPGMELLPADIGIVLDEDKVLIDGTNDHRMELPLSEIGSVLNGFEFSDFKTKLYISGSPLLSKAKINMIIEEIDTDENGVKIYTQKNDEEKITIVNNGINIDDLTTDGEYKEKDCPEGGIDIDFPLTGKDIAVSFKVYIPEGTKLEIEDFKAGNIKVDVLVWLPFALTAGSGGAEIAFPKDAFFDSEKDLFNRENAGEDNMLTDIVESMSVSIKFDNNPFNDANLIVESAGGNKSLEINNPVKNNTLSFSLSEEDMKKINDPDYFPFTPNLKIKFDEGKKLRLPREFNATEFGVQAKIRYRIDLQSDNEGIE